MELNAMKRLALALVAALASPAHADRLQLPNEMLGTWYAVHIEQEGYAVAWPAALRQPAPPATLAQRPALN